jgi:hypothetical protein
MPARFSAAHAGQITPPRVRLSAGCAQPSAPQSTAERQGASRLGTTRRFTAGASSAPRCAPGGGGNNDCLAWEEATARGLENPWFSPAGQFECGIPPPDEPQLREGRGQIGAGIRHRCQRDGVGVRLDGATGMSLSSVRKETQSCLVTAARQSGSLPEPSPLLVRRVQYLWRRRRSGSGDHAKRHEVAGTAGKLSGYRRRPSARSRHGWAPRFVGRDGGPEGSGTGTPFARTSPLLLRGKRRLLDAGVGGIEELGREVLVPVEGS